MGRGSRDRALRTFPAVRSIHAIDRPSTGRTRRAFGLASFVVVLPVLAALLLGGPAANADTVTEVRLTTPYPSLSVEPGSTVKLDLDARAPHSERVDLSVPNLPSGWKATLRGGGFVIGGLTAGPDTAGTAQLELDVPADAPAGDHPVEVVETAPDGVSRLELTITVAAVVDSGIGVTADFPSITGGPTDTFAYNLTVTNNTPTQQTFNFAGTGPDGWTVTASPEAQSRANTVSIDGGATAKVSVSAVPPASVKAGKYPIDVVVTGANGASGKIELGAEVTGTAKLGLSTSDQRLNLSGPAKQARRETLVVDNSGTAPLTKVSFSSTPPSGWKVTFEPPTVDSIDAGQSAQVVAVITPSKDAVAGDYAVGVSASSGSSNGQVALRYSVTTSWSWGLVGAGLIVVALAVLGFGYRRLGRR